MNIKGINILCNISVGNGPAVTLQNLISGLNILGIDSQINKLNSKYPTVHFNAHSNEELLRQKIYLSGPNVLNSPTGDDYAKKYHDKYRNYVLGSKWLQKTFEYYDPNVNTFFWQWGTNTDFWKPSINSNEKKGCFIYSKRRNNKEINKLQDICHKLGIVNTQIKYGYYSIDNLKKACNNHRFCIVASRQESNPNFLLEILSMNTPCLVLDWNNHWLPELKGKIEVSTATEWDQSFGHKIKPLNNTYDLNSILLAIEDLNKNYSAYNPRYIIEKKYNLVSGAKNYINILEKVL